MNETSLQTDAPLAGETRLVALDALRGLALLGILIANVRQLMLPFDLANLPLAAAWPEWLARLDWTIFIAAVDLKFLTLFSLLFGLGFALQKERATTIGGDDRMPLRRMLLLLCFGIAHGMLLYPAEVLTPYALAGLLLIALHRLRAEAQLLLGVMLLGASLLWGYQIGALSRVSPLGLVCIAALVLGCLWASRYGWRRLLRVWAVLLVLGGAVLTVAAAPGKPEHAKGHEMQQAQQQWQAMHEDDPAQWPQEFKLRREAGVGAVLELHAGHYAKLLLFTALLLLWRTLGLFLIGVALYRLGLAARLGDAAFWRRVARAGIGWGLPLSLIAAWLMLAEYDARFDLRWPAFLHHLAALPLAAGLAGAIFALCAGGRAQRLVRWLQDAGRMPLSNYIAQSLLVAALAESWGAGWFGRLEGPQLSLLALAVFGLQLAGSRAWLRHFRLGPLEWLWRCGSYRRWLPLRRAPARA